MQGDKNASFDLVKISALCDPGARKSPSYRLIHLEGATGVSAECLNARTQFAWVGARGNYTVGLASEGLIRTRYGKAHTPWLLS